jgi:hypothetical protein
MAFPSLQQETNCQHEKRKITHKQQQRRKDVVPVCALRQSRIFNGKKATPIQKSLKKCVT